MSAQKDTKKSSGEGGESGNIKAYTKAKLSGKNVCRQMVKPITWRLKENQKAWMNL